MRSYKQMNIQVTQAQYDALKRIAEEKGIYSLSALLRSALVQYFSLPTNGHKETASARK